MATDPCLLLFRKNKTFRFTPLLPEGWNGPVSLPPSALPWRMCDLRLIRVQAWGLRHVTGGGAKFCSIHQSFLFIYKPVGPVLPCIYLIQLWESFFILHSAECRQRSNSSPNILFWCKDGGGQEYMHGLRMERAERTDIMGKNQHPWFVLSSGSACEGWEA